MESDRKEGASDPRANSALKALGQGQGGFTQWRVQFMAESDPGNWIEGRVRLSHLSRWMALFDLENDVLASDHLPDGDSIEVDQCPTRSEVIDLTETMVPARPGGRFWALIDSDDEDQEDDHKSTGSLLPPQASGPTVLPVIKGVPDRWHSKAQNSKPIMKPWIGPIPKVFREPVTLSEFLPDSWTLVTLKKKNKGKKGRLSPPSRPSVARSASDIRTARRARLNSLLGIEARLIAEPVVGLLDSGDAQLEAQAEPVLARTGVHVSISPNVVVAPRVFEPGFPTLGERRARRVAYDGNMVGRGPPLGKRGTPTAVCRE